MSNDEFHIEKAKKEDVKEILQFLKEDFLKTEPLNVALGIGPDEAEEFFEEIIQASLEAPLSYVVKANHNQKIIGVRLASIIRRPDASEKKVENFSFDSKNERTWRFRPTQELLHHLEEKIWSSLPSEIHTLLSWLVLSVSSSYTRRGIARLLINHNWDEIRAFGCQGFVTEATAFNSQQLFQKAGYKRLYTIELNKWLDEDGNVIFKCQDNTKLATLEYLELPKV